MEAYRYGGGIGYRATAEWNKDNSWVNTSEGKKRIDADGTKSRWTDVVVSLKIKEHPGLFSSHTIKQGVSGTNAHLAINQNGRGDVYFQFTPIRYQTGC